MTARYTYAMHDFDAQIVPECWFAASGVVKDPCRGRIQKCHLISKQRIKRELGAKTTKEVIWDERVWVPGCEVHHYRLDFLRNITVLRDQLPPAVEEYAAEHGLERFLDREYGERLSV